MATERPRTPRLRTRVLRGPVSHADEPLPTRPWVSVAALCETAFFDEDRMLSAIRIVDQVNLHWQRVRPDRPLSLDEFRTALAAGEVAVPAHRLYIVVRLQGGAEPAEVELGITFERPDRTYVPPTVHTVKLAPFGAHQMVAQTVLSFQHDGRHWVRVTIDGELQARIPLLVAFQEDPPDEDDEGAVVQAVTPMKSSAPDDDDPETATDDARAAGRAALPSNTSTTSRSRRGAS